MQGSGARTFLRRTFVCLTLGVCLLLFAGGMAAAAAARHQAFLVNPDELRYPEQPFVIPKSERIALENGLIVYFLEDH